MARVALVVLGFASTLLFGYIAIRDVDPQAVWRALEGTQLGWLAPSAAVLAVAIALRAWRWQLMFEPATQPPFRPVLTSLLLGYLFNSLLPARAGEAVRIVALRQQASTPRAETLATVIIERVFDVGSLLLLFFSAVVWLPPVTWLREAAILALFAALSVIAVVLAIWHYGDRAVRVLLWPLRLVPGFHPQRFESAVSNMLHGCAALRRPRQALAVLAVTTASWLVMAVSFWLLTFAFDLGVPPGAGLLVVVTINLTLILPSSPAGLGLFEAATVVALHAYGVPQSEALSYALVLHALNFVPFVLIGVVILARHPMLRSIARRPATA